MAITEISDASQPLIIAEVAQNHDGSLGMCHAYIDALADSGAQAIKFQTHIAAEESTLDETFRIAFSQQDATRYNYWKRMEFTYEQWAGLKQHADEKAILFLSTPFSIAAVELLEKIEVPFWKIGSGDTHYPEMMEAILKTQKPVILSSGMSDWIEIETNVERLKQHDAEFALMQCTSMYPTPLEKVGLNILDELHSRYSCRIGLSDHSGSLSPAMAAIARGYNLIELHATFDKRMFGPDVCASVTIEQIAQLNQFAQDVTTMNVNPVNKEALAKTLKTQKQLFSRSVGLKNDLPTGHSLTATDLIAKKPGSGIPWAEKGQLIGKKVKQNCSRDYLLKKEDVE
jgi:N-acetylneuraminate synthase